MVKTKEVPKSRTMFILLAASLMPLLSEAFMHHYGMHNNNNYNNNSSRETTTKEKKTQAEKLQNPWLWVAIIAFSICMFYCLRISMDGRWKQVCGSEPDEEADGNRGSLLGGGGGGGGNTYQRGNMAGFR